MTGEVTEKKSQVSNNALLAILGVLIILIVALVIGVAVHNTINNGGKTRLVNQAGLDELIAEVEGESSGEGIASPVGAEVFSKKVGNKVENGDLTAEEAYSYYETVMDIVAERHRDANEGGEESENGDEGGSGEGRREGTGARSTAELRYAYKYATSVYEWDGDEDRARAIMAKADPKNGPEDKAGLTDDEIHFLELFFVQYMAGLCKTMGDEEGKAYYDNESDNWKYLDQM